MSLKILHENPKNLGTRAQLRSFFRWGEIRVAEKIVKDSPEWNAAIAHEMTHWNQQQSDMFRYYFKYQFSAKHRLRYEIEAHVAEHISYGDDNYLRLELMSKRISSLYRLDIDPSAVLVLLNAEIERIVQRNTNDFTS